MTGGQSLLLATAPAAQLKKAGHNKWTVCITIARGRDASGHTSPLMATVYLI